MLAIWSLVPLPFFKTSLNIWKFTVHVLLKPGLENFEHYKLNEESVEQWSPSFRIYCLMIWGRPEIIIEIRCTINIMHLNHPKPSPPPTPVLETCLPQKQSLVPKRSGTTAIDGKNIKRQERKGYFFFSYSETSKSWEKVFSWLSPAIHSGLMPWFLCSALPSPLISNSFSPQGSTWPASSST